MTLREMLIDKLVAWSWPGPDAKLQRKLLNNMSDKQLMERLDDHIDDIIYSVRRDA